MEIVKTEQALIGSILNMPDKLVDVAGIVSPADFTDTRAGVLFSSMLDMWQAGTPVDTMTVITRNSEMVEYIAGAGSVGYWFNAVQYANDIAECAKVKRLLVGVDRIKRDGSSSEIINQVLDLYNNEAEAGKKESSVSSVMGRFDRCVSENKKRGSIGLDTGFDFLRGKMVQYVPGQVWTIGGYTSTGKTAMMIQKLSSLFLGNENARVSVISTEMTEEQVIARFLGNITGIYSQRILAGDYRNGEEEAVGEAKDYVCGLNLSIYDDIFTLLEIETAARKQNMRGGLDVMFIDYVQNCHVDGTTSEYAAQSILAKRIQKLAKDVSATIICLSQVSNDVGRGNTDNFELKGAGEWAAVTDVGVMLQRNKTDDRALRYSVRKNRHGAKCENTFRYSNNFSRLIEDRTGGYV